MSCCLLDPLCTALNLELGASKHCRQPCSLPCPVRSAPLPSPTQSSQVRSGQLNSLHAVKNETDILRCSGWLSVRTLTLLSSPSAPALRPSQPRKCLISAMLHGRCVASMPASVRQPAIPLAAHCAKLIDQQCVSDMRSEKFRKLNQQIDGLSSHSRRSPTPSF